MDYRSLERINQMKSWQLRRWTFHCFAGVVTALAGLRPRLDPLNIYQSSIDRLNPCPLESIHSPTHSLTAADADTGLSNGEPRPARSTFKVHPQYNKQGPLLSSQRSHNP